MAWAKRLRCCYPSEDAASDVGSKRSEGVGEGAAEALPQTRHMDSTNRILDQTWDESSGMTTLLQGVVAEFDPPVPHHAGLAQV